MKAQNPAAPQSEFPRQEIPAPKRGRPSDPNARVSRTVAFRPNDMAYLRLYFSDPNAPDTGQVNDALERLIEQARLFWPQGPNAARERDEKGRFVAAPGTSKTAITRRRKRERKETEQ